MVEEYEARLDTFGDEWSSVLNKDGKTIDVFDSEGEKLVTLRATFPRDLAPVLESIADHAASEGQKCGETEFRAEMAALMFGTDTLPERHISRLPMSQHVVNALPHDDADDRDAIVDMYYRLYQFNRGFGRTNIAWKFRKLFEAAAAPNAF